MGGRSTQSEWSQSQIEGMGQDEKDLVKRLTELGINQADAIETVIQGTKAMQPFSLELRGADRAALDNAYAGAEQNLRRFGGLMGQDLAGTRGLNPSDTPVSEAVLRETLPVMASLQDSKAQYGLGLGLNLAQLNEGMRQFNLGTRLNAAQVLPPGLGLNLNRMQNERFAKAMKLGGGSKTESLSDSILKGAQTYNQIGQGTNQFSQAGAGGMMSMMSDERLKQDITPVRWQWNGGSDEQLGVVAQQVQQSHPHLVKTHPEHGYLMVDYGAMVAMLLSEREWLYQQLAEKEQGPAVGAGREATA